MAGAASLSIETKGAKRIKGAFRALGEDDAPYLQAAMTEVGQDLSNNVSARAPGSMASRTSFVGVKGKGAALRSVVSVRHPGAKTLEFGRNPITVVAKRKDALSWSGARHPVRKVRQGKRAPRPFVGIKDGELAVGATMEAAPAILGKAVEAEFARLAGGSGE